MVPGSGLAAREILAGKILVDESKVKCPMLVISAKEDRASPTKMVRKISEKYGSDFKEYQFHAHWIIQEIGWQSVAKDILEWIDKKIKN
jgi:alpha-beta hydrolase superfamily lysophospholipase